MTEHQEQIERLLTRLDRLVKTQVDFQREVGSIRSELELLRSGKPVSAEVSSRMAKPVIPTESVSAKPDDSTGSGVGETTKLPPPDRMPDFGYGQKATGDCNSKVDAVMDSARSDLEKFIGENLLNKVGVVILIIGVAIGAKFAIDQGWISPLVRILFGYACGLTLFGFAVKLRAKYETFSSVLISGSLAILYFVTYFAYVLYGFFGQIPAFGVMVMITAVAVAAALWYSRQIIAHLGLVGAYATPFLLSSDSGNYPFLFSYVAIVNVGILAVSLQRYWKPLFYTSFVITWLIYLAWYAGKYQPGIHFDLAIVFATLFFATFYAIFVGYKFRSGENVAAENIGLVLANSAVYYGVGYTLVDGNAAWSNYLGLFTIANAAVHLAFANVAARIKSVSVDFLYLLGALVLTFITISIPVQFDGQAITFAWTAQALLLFLIGRIRPIELFEFVSYPLMFLASVSLFVDFAARTLDIGKGSTEYFPIANGFFFSSLFYVAVFFTIFAVSRSEAHQSPFDEGLQTLMRYAIAFAGGIVLYNAFRVQMSEYYSFLATKTAMPEVGYGTFKHTNADLDYFNILWQINYSMLFATLLAAANLKWFRSSVLVGVNVASLALSVVAFLVGGLWVLSELRDSYLRPAEGALFAADSLNLVIRYVSYVFVAAVFVALYQYTRSKLAGQIQRDQRILSFDLFLAISLLIILSSELVHWMDLAGFTETFKMGLSIFWGIYALALVGVGIYFGKRHLRILAIVLFAMTIVKLFIYDIAELDTVAKTAVFVSLGALMLIVSFLYHKYKALIFWESDL